MVGQALSILAQMFSDLFGLFDEVFTKLDAWGLLLGAFLVYTIYRLLLAPVLGGLISSGASDVVRYIREDAKAVKNVQVGPDFSKAKKKGGK